MSKEKKYNELLLTELVELVNDSVGKGKIKDDYPSFLSAFREKGLSSYTLNLLVEHAKKTSSKEQRSATATIDGSFWTSQRKENVIYLNKLVDKKVYIKRRGWVYFACVLLSICLFEGLALIGLLKINKQKFYEGFDYAEREHQKLKDKKEPSPSIPSEVTRYQTGEFIYYGPLKNRKPHGVGLAIYPENDYDGRKYYIGNFDDGERQDDEAVLFYQNGDYFYGSMKGDEWNRGVFFSNSTSSHFEGSFHNNIPYNGTWFTHQKLYDVRDGEELNDTM